MATKNVIEEYYIDIKARADAAEKDITKALANIAKNSKKMNERMNALELKLKGKTITDKMDKDKQYNIVQDALRKKNLADEQAASKREIDLAKAAYRKKVEAVKLATSRITDSNNNVLKSMRDYYKEQERLAKESFNKTEQIEKKKRDRFNQRQKDRAKLRQIRVQEEQRELSAAQKALSERLAIYKKKKRQAEKVEKEITKNLQSEIKARAALEKKVQSYKETDYYRRVQEANPMAAAKYDKDFKNALAKGDINEIKDVAREVRRASRDMTRSMNGLAFAQNGLRDSTRNMIRSYVSLFALFEGTRAIKNVGMDLESLDAAMLAASKNQVDAGNKMKFVKDQAFKLGTDLKTAAKAYMQLSIASKGILSQKETDALFVATLESATALGMSLDDTQGTFRSFVQMLSKGNVQAEELRGQLG